MSKTKNGRRASWVATVFAVLLISPIRLCAVDPHTPISQYAHTAWRLEDGLLSSPPTAITQTKDGFIWIGTDSDLLRFDGVKFTPWREATGQAPMLAPVTSLLGATDGSLWIGTTEGLEHWDGQKLTVFARDIPASIAEIAEDHPGTVWVARIKQRRGDRHPICRVSLQRTDCFGAESGMANTSTRSLIRDSQGDIWSLGTAALTFYSPSATKNYVIDSLKRNQGLSSGSLIFDRHGGLWVGFLY